MTEPVAKPIAGIMKEGEEDEEDDDQIEVEENDELDAKFAPIENQPDGPKGKLVQDIMSEMKQDEKQGDIDAKDGGPNSGKSGIRMGRLKKRGIEKKSQAGFSQSEINALRKSIQQLCQATNPLGKCMDYVHDDMEMMNKELEQWKSEYRRKCEDMDEQSKSSEEALQPKQMRLREIKEEILEEEKKINSVKAKIAKNDARIQQLLRMVVHV